MVTKINLSRSSSSGHPLSEKFKPMPPSRKLPCLAAGQLCWDWGFLLYSILRLCHCVERNASCTRTLKNFNCIHQHQWKSGKQEIQFFKAQSLFHMYNHGLKGPATSTLLSCSRDCTNSSRYTTCLWPH